MNLEEAERRFHTDATWHALVVALMGQLTELRVSPAELREAAVYAAYRVYLTTPGASVLPWNDDFEELAERVARLESEGQR